MKNRICAYMSVILLCSISCSKEAPLMQPSCGEEAVELQSVIFELNGKQYVSYANGKGGALCSDTIKLQEEGLRQFRIAGYSPPDAFPVPEIGKINFHHDRYSFNHAGDSVVILGGKFAEPCNYYLSFKSGTFVGLEGAVPCSSPVVEFYNYTNPVCDFATVEADGAIYEVLWSSLGKYRRFRIEVPVLQGNRDLAFSLPYYELPNSVHILNATGGPLLDGIVPVHPGDTLQLEFKVDAPDEFVAFEWAKGVANDRYAFLNAEEVEKAYSRMVYNPLLSTEKMRYTYSKVHLSREGILTVDKDFNPFMGQGTVPICIIFMPYGNVQGKELERCFRFPAGEVIETLPTPFFCNAGVKIVCD